MQEGSMRKEGYMCKEGCMHGNKHRSVFIRILLAFVLVWGSILAPSASAQADIRGSDVVSGNPIGEGHPTIPDAPDIVADYAALCTKSGTVLWERNATSQVPMASTTKIMTALVALEKVSPDTQMVVTYGAAWTEGSSANLWVNDAVSLKDLIICMMVPSGNDAAVAIAENVAGTEYAFTKMMNDKAAELGMTGTHFSNASGLWDEDNYTTARDYLILTRVAMSNDLFRSVVAIQEVTLWIDDRELYYASTNYLLDELEGANGVKTGFTDAAGYCLVASAKRNSFEFYAVVFHSSSEWQRFEDAKTLLEWGFAHYRTVELINSAKPVADLACLSWIDKTVPVVAESPISVNLFDYDGQITQEVTLIEREGRIKKGEVVGSVIWTQRGDVIAHVDLLATEDVPAPNFWEWLGIWWNRFIGGFFGDPAHATSTTILPPVFDLQIPNVNNR